MPKAKPRGRARQMAPEERRQQLLAAGVACIAAKGIGSTKHADLARACKVSVPAVFSYFPNREALVTSILNEVGEQLFEHVIQPAQALPVPSRRLAATAPLFTQYAAQHPDYVKVWLIWSMHFAPDVREQYRKFEQQQIDALAEMMMAGEANDDPEEDFQDRARMILASSAFLAKMVFDGVSEKRRKAFVQHVLEPLAAMNRS
jgi:AcrR family transcriptional regulator